MFRSAWCTTRARGNGAKRGSAAVEFTKTPALVAARFEDCSVVVYGHTHVPQVEQFQHLWVLNPGSPTERRSALAHSMIVLNIRGPRLTPELVTL